MAKNESEESSVGMQYFRTKILGLSVVVGDPEPEKGIIAPKTLQFTAYEIAQPVGEPIRMAFLATNNGIAISKLSKDPNVKIVNKDEYERYTDLNSEDPKIKRARI